MRPSVQKGAPRGMLDLRGLIHAHSVYSHDACDEAPRDPVTDAVDEPCFDDFRKGICAVGHDFVMLTDHNESFGRTDYPDTLLFRQDRGDTLIERDGEPVASSLACPASAVRPLVLAGTESGAMVVGLEGHVPGTVEERQAIYGDASAAAIEVMKAEGAVAILQHTEDWSAEQIADLPVDGFEMYNLHANLMSSFAEVVELLFKVNKPDEMPAPDLVLLPVFKEDPRYLATWGSALAGGARRVTTMATDCHRNVFPALLADGERVDSYRRMMAWFSNHLLVRPAPGGSFDDRSLKDALRQGRLYGAFELMGYPVGFDYHAASGGADREMGEEVSLAAGATLLVSRPAVDGLDPAAEAPRIVTRLLRAQQGGWEVVAEGEGDLAFAPTKVGVYRAEVRMTPRHLRGPLSSYAALADKEFPWIYANAIYVVD